MIEVVYRQEKKDTNYQDAGFKLPKNIKQIGGGESDIQVYMEDEVCLYLSKVPDREEDIRYGVLLGNVKRSCGYTYIFIDGAVDVREVFDNTVLFGDDIWTALNDDISQYFPGSKVVGWFLSQWCSNSNQNIWIKKMHLNNFAGMDKVFLKIDREEEEENFYYYGKEQMEKIPCYHIYYEKNQPMSEYILQTNADIRFKRALSSEGRGGAVSRAAQKKAEEIKAENEDKSSASATSAGEDAEERFKYGRYTRVLGRAASFLIIGALAVTIGVMGVNGQFDNLTKELKTLVDNIMGGGKSDSDNENDNIISVNGVPTDNKTANNEEPTTEPATAEPDTDGEQETTAAAEEETTGAEEQTVSIAPLNTTNYMVEQGDTLYSICMKLYGNTQNMNIIIELNNLENADSIYYGKNLIVP